MSDVRTRRILRNFFIFSTWGFLVLLFDLGGVVWVLGGIILVVILVRHDLAADRPVKESERPGPSVEWID